MKANFFEPGVPKYLVLRGSIVVLRLSLLVAFSCGTASLATSASEFAVMDSVISALHSDGECGLNLSEAVSYFQDLGIPCGRDRDPKQDRTVFEGLMAGAELLARSPCLASCEPIPDGTPILELLDVFRFSLLRYYSCPHANPVSRAYAIAHSMQVYRGPEIWREGLEAIVRFPPHPDSTTTMAEALMEFSGHATADPERFCLPGFILAGVAAEHRRYDMRLDLAVSLIAQELSEDEGSKFLEPGTFDVPSTNWLEHRILQPARTLVKLDLQIYYRKNGHGPPAVADSVGRPLPTALPLLLRQPAEPGDPTPPVGCWFTGWPGLRIRHYRLMDDSCTIVVSGTDFDCNATWEIQLN